MGTDKTKWIFEDGDDATSRNTGGGDGAFTESLNSGADEPTNYGREGDTTRLMQMAEKTEIYHSGKAKTLKAGTDLSEVLDPVVGWLVVVKGPGLGQAVTLGAGMNTVGREGSERAPLPYGDTLISAKDHVRIIYDDADRKFYIAHGSGKNISKVNGQMVANLMPLESHALIELSKATHVRFVAFCDAGFDWGDLASDGA
ncbi:MAG: FHA domain-containing protein [Rhodobacteraceae bacterium]|nr:FHA domain-containing protein [Paracoccaceae bacterium]